MIQKCQRTYDIYQLIVMRGTRFPSAEEHPPSPPFKGGEEQSEALGKKASHLGGGL